MHSIGIDYSYSILNWVPIIINNYQNQNQKDYRDQFHLSISLIYFCLLFYQILLFM